MRKIDKIDSEESMRKELLASATAFFPVPAAQLWEVVTDNKDTAWRSDLIKVEMKFNLINFISTFCILVLIHFIISII